MSGYQDQPLNPGEEIFTSAHQVFKK